MNLIENGISINIIFVITERNRNYVANEKRSIYTNLV